MKEGCVIAPGVTLGLDGDISLGRNVSLSPGVVLYTATHPIGFGSQRMLPYIHPKPIVIEDGAWIGMGAVLPGVTVGHGSVVSAGAVVTMSVPPDTLVAGNPAAARDSLRLVISDCTNGHATPAVCRMNARDLRRAAGRAGRLAEAETIYVEVLAENAGHPAAALGLVRLLDVRGQRRDAERNAAIVCGSVGDKAPAWSLRRGAVRTLAGLAARGCRHGAGGAHRQRHSGTAWGSHPGRLRPGGDALPDRVK